MTRRKVLIALLCFLTNVCVNAQTGRHFDADKQMSSSFTTQIYQDHDGFIWVATRNGLNRYDGYQVKSRFPESGDPQLKEVFNQPITALEEDAEGHATNRKKTFTDQVLLFNYTDVNKHYGVTLL